MKKIIGGTAIAILALGTTAALAMDNPAQNAHEKIKSLWGKNDRSTSQQVSVTDESAGNKSFGRVQGKNNFGPKKDVYSRLRSVQPKPSGGN